MEKTLRLLVTSGAHLCHYTLCLLATVEGCLWLDVLGTKTEHDQRLACPEFLMPLFPTNDSSLWWEMHEDWTIVLCLYMWYSFLTTVFITWTWISGKRDAPHIELDFVTLEREQEEQQQQKNKTKQKTTYSLPSLRERSENPGALDRRDWESQEANPLPRTVLTGYRRFGCRRGRQESI